MKNVQLLSKLFLVCAVAMMPFAQAAYSESYALDNGMSVRAKLNNATNIQWEVTCDFAGWCGFGIGGSTMIGIDMFVIEDLQGSPVVSDRWSDNRVLPPSDLTNDYTLTENGTFAILSEL